MTTSQPFADRLIAARTARGMTQDEAARSLGVHRVTWANWERGASVPKGLALKAADAWIARTRKGGNRGS